jgi:parallel beta-helix repeat protein
MERRTFIVLTTCSYLATMATSFHSQAANEPLSYYIAANGDNQNSGRSPDRPFATLEHARNAIRQLKQQQKGQLSQEVKVILRGGTYYLNQPFRLTPEDSGQENAIISYQAYPGETPILSGGKQIQGWQEETVNQRKMWTVKLPEVQQGKWYFQQLWVNGTRRYRARYPAEGYLQIQEVTPHEDWQQGHDNFIYGSKDLPQDISEQNGEAVVLNRWVESRLPIKEIDTNQNRLSFTKTSVFRLTPGDNYYLENILSALTTPGQWYLDSNQGKLYYLPLSGEKIDNTEVIAPVLENIVLLEGSSPQDQFVKYLNFSQLVFSHTDWQIPPKISGFAHNAFGVSGAFLANSTEYCTWDNCTFTHLGNHGLELFRGCHYNRILNSEFSDLGAGAIKIGERKTHNPQIKPQQISHHNQVVNNHIFDGGKFFHSAVGVRTVLSHDNLISRNHIHDLFYTGISNRGVWGFKDTNAYNNVVEYNHVHHIGKLANGEGPMLSDMGAIYNLGSQKGTVIRHNLVTDVSAARYGGWGIYLDEGSSYILIENNIVSRTNHGGFMQHYGKENILRNNIFAFGNKAQLHRAPRDLKISQQRQHNSFRCEQNIFYWEQGDFFGGIQDNPTSNVIFDYNLYWNQSNQKIQMADMSWQQWQDMGQDVHSLIAKPLFFAPERGDFRLEVNSPAVKLGFQTEFISNLINESLTVKHLR